MGAPAPRHVFISYRRGSDSTFAHLIALALRERGFTTKLDVDSDEAGPYPARLERMIGAADGFVLVLSRTTFAEARDPDWVVLETGLALAREGLPIVPVLNGSEDLATIPVPDSLAAVKNLQAVRVVEEYRDPAFDRLGRMLRSRSPVAPTAARGEPAAAGQADPRPRATRLGTAWRIPAAVTASFAVVTLVIAAVSRAPARLFPSRCGDGIRASDEQCDDGNRDDRDRCRNDCMMPPPAPAPPPKPVLPTAPAGMVLVTRVDGTPWFFVDAKPVTAAAYALAFPKLTKPSPETADRPVVNAPFNFAKAYAQTVGKRLLTDEEWEAAIKSPGVTATANLHEWIGPAVGKEAPVRSIDGRETRPLNGHDDVTFRLGRDPSP